MADSRQEDYLFQRVSLVRENEIVADLDLSFLKEATLIETLDLSGPKLILTFDDPDSIIRDELGLRAKDILEVRVADMWVRDEMDQTMRFVVWTPPNEGRIVVLNCMEESVHRLKQPAKDAVLFRRPAAEAVLRRLAPGLKYSCSSFPAIEDYHLLPGERPTKLLRKMAMEKASVCFYRRGRLYFKRLAELYASLPEITYEYNNPQAENQIEAFAIPNTESLIGDLHLRNFIGWDMVKGFVRSGRETRRPPEFVSVANIATMDNLLRVAYPAIDFPTAGNGALMPGITLALKWHTDRLDAPIDESLPPKILIGTVSHWYSAQKYISRVKGVVVR